MLATGSLFHFLCKFPDFRCPLLEGKTVCIAGQLKLLRTSDQFSAVTCSSTPTYTTIGVLGVTVLTAVVNQSKAVHQS